MTLVFQTIFVEFLTCIEMSKAFLERVLKQELKILQEDSDFVRLTSESEVHKFSSSQVGVRNEINRQLSEGNYADPEVLQSPRVQDVIKRGAKEMVKDAYENIIKWAGGIDNVDIRGNRGAFSAITQTVTGGFSARQRQYVDELTTFETMRKSYENPKKRLVTGLNKVLREESTAQAKKPAKKIDGRYFLDLDHRAGSVISKQEVSQSKARLSTKISDRNAKAPGREITKEDLEDLDIELFVSKKDTEDQTTVSTGLRAAKLNRGKDSTKQKEAKAKFVKKLEDALIKLNESESWAKRPGSDSRLTIEKKKVIKSFQESVKRGKNVKKPKTSNTKPKYSNTTVKTKVSKKPKKGKEKTVGIGKLPIKKARAPRSSASSTINLASIINQKLPETVAKNMKLPGLQYRTGRFASSVRVTDVATTRGGFPSIGYTYQRNPYQTFEPGGKQGSTDRDPRKVIDKSIREIAAGLLVGRFYTRRV